jgi:hypothetical protein
MVETAVVGCFLHDQLTAPPYITTTQPVVLRRVSRQAAKFASHHVSMGVVV